jgi:hypothetical protein
MSISALFICLFVLGGEGCVVYLFTEMTLPVIPPKEALD